MADETTEAREMCCSEEFDVKNISLSYDGDTRKFYESQVSFISRRLFVSVYKTYPKNKAFHLICLILHVYKHDIGGAIL